MGTGRIRYGCWHLSIMGFPTGWEHLSAVGRESPSRRGCSVMAETLANGTVVPQGSDLIHASGVQAMRNMGASVDSQLGNRALVGHTHPIAGVVGLQSALDGKMAKEPVNLGSEDL